MPRKLKKADIEAYLVKPVKQSRLFDCLASAMARATDENAMLKSTQPAPAALNPKQGLSLEKMRILLAEDNRINQQVALGHLRKLGLEAGMNDYLSKPARAAELQAAPERGKRTVQNPAQRSGRNHV